VPFQRAGVLVITHPSMETSPAIPLFIYLMMALGVKFYPTTTTNNGCGKVIAADL
jgi:hypothetical protein